MPAFYDNQQDYIDKLNEMYAAFAAGPYDAVPKTGGVMTGPLTVPTLIVGVGGATGITKAMVGLSNADNTRDADKPVSTVQQAALDARDEALAAAGGASTVGLLIDDSLTFYRDLQDTLRDAPVNIKSVGILGAGNDRAILQKATDLCKNGRTLDLGNSVLDLGTIGAGTAAIFIDSPVGMRIIGNAAEIKCVCVSGRSSIFRVKNAVDFTSNGVNVTQPGYDILGPGRTERDGVYLYHFYGAAPYSASTPCGNIQVDGIAHDCAGFVTIDCTTQMGVSDAIPYSVRNVKISGACSRVYYASSSIYGARDIDVDITCLDVKRGFISYGQDRGKVNLALECTAGFLGSNAFCSLACEGSATGDVKDVDIRVKVSGVESHTGIVTFYHQASGGTTGSIANIKAYVTLDNLTTVGKNPTLPSFNVFSLLHENPATGGAFASTIRETKNLDIDCEVLGSISGKTINLQTVPLTPYPISLGRGVTEGLTNFDMWVYFKVKRGAKTLSFSPAASGRTTFGSATYSLQKGVLSVSDGVATCTGSMIWTGNTGTGNLYVSIFPLKGVSSSVLGNPPATVVTTGFGAAGTIAQGLMTGQMDELTIYSVDLTSHGAVVPSVPASGSIYFSCTYPIYG